jgi:hypothetical protein
VHIACISAGGGTHKAQQWRGGKSRIGAISRVPHKEYKEATDPFLF